MKPPWGITGKNPHRSYDRCGFFTIQDEKIGPKNHKRCDDGDSHGSHSSLAIGIPYQIIQYAILSKVACTGKLHAEVDVLVAL